MHDTAATWQHTFMFGLGVSAHACVAQVCARHSCEEGICQRVWSRSGQSQWRAAGTVPFMVNADGARRDAKAITDGWGGGDRGLGGELGGWVGVGEGRGVEMSR